MTKSDINEPMNYIEKVIEEFEALLQELQLDQISMPDHNVYGNESRQSKKLESFIKFKLEELIEEIRNQMYRGATKDEVHRILDALKGGKEILE